MASERGYQFIFPIGEHRYVFEGSPNFPWFNCMNIGLERPIELVAGREYHIQLIVDDTIATLYVNGVALNARMYRPITAEDGQPLMTLEKKAAPEAEHSTDCCKSLTEGSGFHFSFRFLPDCHIQRS